MAVYGDLSTMPLPELLQWLGGNGKSGSLEVERDKICKEITFQRGHVIASASNDPRELFGHFLVSRGQITEDLLRIALDQQASAGKPLGMTLVEMGVLSSEELIRNLSAKAEETIFSLFEWEQAIFRFHDGPINEDPMFPVDIRVEDILLRGMQRLDEVRRIREVFDNPGIVPQRTEKLPPPEVFRNRMARRIYESINGERAVADILLHAHGSEYLVTKFLFELHRTGLVAIREVRPLPATPASVVPPPDAPAPEPASATGPAVEEPAPTTMASAGPAASPAREPDPVPAEVTESLPGYQPRGERDLEEACKLMSQGDFDRALVILDRLYREDPQNDSLRRLTREAETAFVDKAYKHYVPGDKVAVLARSLESLESEDLSPKDYFILSRIDGVWTVRSIIQVSPIREVEALQALKRMKDRGIVELRDPE